VQGDTLRIGPTTKSLTTGQAVIHNNLYVEADQNITGNLGVTGHIIVGDSTPTSNQYVTAVNLPPSNGRFASGTEGTGGNTFNKIQLPYATYYEKIISVNDSSIAAGGTAAAATINPPNGVYWTTSWYGDDNADSVMIITGVRLSGSNIIVWYGNADSNNTRRAVGNIVLSGFKI
jgi:hypothetical protein